MTFIHDSTIRHGLMAALVVAGLAAGGFAHAEPKIGVVNVAKLLDESPQARLAMQALQEEFAPRQKDILAEQEAMRAREEKGQRDAEVMGEPERRNLERELREAQRELSRKQNEYVEDLNIRRNEELGRLQRSVMQEVEVFAKAQGYDLIIGDGVLYATSVVDVTAQVLARLDASSKAPAPSTPRTP